MEIRTKSRALLKSFNLSFKDKKMEQDYLTYYRKSTVNHLRIAMLIALPIYGIFALLDHFLFPELSAVFFMVRFYFVFPSVILLLAYTYLAHQLKELQLLTSLSVLVGGSAIIYMLYLGGPEVSVLYYAGLTLVFSSITIFLNCVFNRQVLLGPCYCWVIFLLLLK